MCRTRDKEKGKAMVREYIGKYSGIPKGEKKQKKDCLNDWSKL